MRNFALVVNIAIAGTSECLDGKNIAFLHLGRVARLDNGNALGSMNAVGKDCVTGKVADRLDRIRRAIDLALVAFHSFLYLLSQLAKTHIDASFLHAGIGGILDGRQQVVVHGIECHCEGTVDNASIDVDANVDFHDIALLEHRLIAGIRTEVCRNVIKI